MGSYPTSSHFIIGERGNADTANNTDGVVACWSSHLKRAKSELIVPSASLSKTTLHCE